MARVLAGVADQSDSYADAIAQENQNQKSYGNKNSQNDEKNEPGIFQSQIRVQIGGECNLGQTEVGAGHVFQVLVALVAIPAACRVTSSNTSTETTAELLTELLNGCKPGGSQLGFGVYEELI